MKWWDSGDYDYLSREIADEDAKWRTVCRVFTRQYTSIEKDNTEPWPKGEENFRLILKAPQMLEALEAIVRIAGQMKEATYETTMLDWETIEGYASEAIAAVKGENDDLESQIG